MYTLEEGALELYTNLEPFGRARSTGFGVKQLMVHWDSTAEQGITIFVLKTPWFQQSGGLKYGLG